MKSLLEEFADNNFLITTSQWFFAPDGKQYRAVWGKVEVHSDESTLGIKTNDKSTNWYVIVGEKGANGRRCIVAGCQIHYACVCMEKPNTDETTMLKIFERPGEQREIRVENAIYLAQ